MTRYVDGSVLAGSNMREGIDAASAQLVAEGYPEITVVDGDREYDDQVRIFKQRYVPSSQVGGRFVYDRRWWEGQWWSRISSAGTVAAPSREAPHVAKIAADLGYPYNNRNTGAHKRLQQIAGRYGLEWTGVNFGEDWHWQTTRGVGRIGVPASGGASPFTPAPVEPPKRKKRTMIYAAWRDKNDTIAVQAVAGGKVTLLKDPTEWAGIQAATGAEYAQVENAQLQAILERFGKLESPAFDTTTGAAAQIVVPLDNQPDRYQWAGDRLEWIDGDQLAKLQEQGARTQFLARNQIEKLTS